MMQVPSEWIREFDDPATLMQDWDTAMDAVSELFGLPRIRPKSVLYLQADVMIRSGAYAPGYPQSNIIYDPYGKGKSSHWLLKGPQFSSYVTFHELGHAHLFTKFRGEVEAAVNLPYVAVLNKGFSVDLDTAFGKSRDQESISLDQAAVMWMVTENMAGNPVLGEMLTRAFATEGSPQRAMVEAIERAIETGEIAPVDPRQLLLTVVSACVFFFVTLPTVKMMNPLAAEDFDAYVEQRKKHVFEVVYYGLASREVSDA